MAEQSRKERNREIRRVWTSHIQAWEKSGLSQVEYCREKDLSKDQFTYWKCKLAREEGSVRFVPISRKLVQPLVERGGLAPIKLIIDSRYEIEIGEGFSPDTLSSLIRTLGVL